MLAWRVWGNEWPGARLELGLGWKLVWSILLGLEERDEDIKKIQAQISGGMTNNASLLQNYLKTWDLYREIWEINKGSFIRRYQRLNPPVSSFDADIAR